MTTSTLSSSPPRELPLRERVVWAISVPTALLAVYLLIVAATAALMPAPTSTTIATIVLPLVLALALRANKRVRGWLRLPVPRHLTSHLHVTGYGLLALPVVFLAGQAGSMMLYQLLGSSNFDDVTATRSTLSAPMVLLLVLVLAPIGEEAMLRGLLLPALRRKLTLVVSIALSTGLFMLLHGNLVQAMVVLPLGVLLALVAERCASIWPCMVIHMLFNLMSVLIPIALIAPLANPVVVVALLGACALALAKVLSTMPAQTARR